MKRSLTALFLTALSLLLLLASGCGGGGGDSRPGGPSLVGRWRQVLLGTDAGATSCPGTLSGVRCGTDDIVQFRADGTLTVSDGSSSQDGTYTLSGSTLTTTLPGGTAAVQAEVAATTLTLRYSDSGTNFREVYNRL